MSMFDDFLESRPEKRSLSLSRFIAIAGSTVLHLFVIYGLYHGKITIKTLSMFGEVQDVVIGPSPKILYPTVAGSSSTATAEAAEEPGTEEEIFESSRQPAGGDPGPALISPESGESGGSSADVPPGHEYIPALSSEFYESLINRFKTTPRSSLSINLGPPGKSPVRAPAADLSRYLFPRTFTPGGRYGDPARALIAGKAGGQRASLSIPLSGYDLVPWAEEVIELIQKNWDLPFVREIPPRARVRIVAVIGKSGALTSLQLLASSSVSVLDQAAVMAIRASLPLPSLPEDFPADLLEAYFEFAYND